MLIEKLKEMSYEIADCVDEANACLDDIRESWNRNEEIDESKIELCRTDLMEAHRRAKTIEIAMKNLNDYLKTVVEVLNDRNY